MSTMMSSLFNNQTVDLVRRDDGLSSDSHTIAFEIIIVIIILFAAFVLIIPPLVFLSPNFGWRSRANDVEANNQRRQPRTIAIHHTRDDDGFVQIDIIDVPPEPAYNPHYHQRQHANQPIINSTAISSFKTRVVNLADAAGKTFTTRSAAFYQTIRRGAEKMKMSRSASSDMYSSEHERARRKRMKGLSIDLPVMKQPAWQRLASGALSPATTLGDFIRHGQDDASTAGTATTAPETNLHWSMPRQQQQPTTEFVETYEDSRKTTSSAMVQDASEEVHWTGVEARGHDQSHGTDQSHGQVEIQMPEPVVMVGLGIAH